MNNPLNAPQSPNELVLRLIGGDRDGQVLTVQNEKCLLSGLLPKTEDTELYRCAIFRGEKGVAFRSYSDHVLCNGAKVSVKWLKQGDLIKLTDNFSVEVIQLGIYTKSAPATPAASVGGRIPTQTISLTADQHPYGNATPAKNNPVATQLLSTVGSPATEPRKFKPATNNLRTPSVTAPLESHQPLASASAPAERAPVHTQPINIAPVDSVVPAGIGNQSSAIDTSGEPAAPATMGSAIDSLTDRLSKLVDVASGVEETPPAAPQSAIAKSVDVQTTETDALVGTASVQTPNMPRVEASGVSDSPQAPVAEAVQSGSVTTPDPQPSTSDDPASRRSALENFFAKSGVSINDASPQEEASAPVANPVSQPPVSSSVEAVADQTPATPATPAVRQTVVTEGVAKMPDFDLDSVLAKLEASAANPASDAAPASGVTQASEASTELSDVANAAVGQTSLEDLLSGEATPSTPAAQQPAPGTETSEAQTVEAQAAAEDQPASTEGNDDNPIKSFALLQSLGLDTTGLSDIKKEIAQSPATEELAAIEPPVDQTEEPEPAKLAPVESVADVLARMQSGGSLEDFSMGDNSPEPEPVPAAPVEAVVAQPSIAHDIDVAGDDEDSSVEDYMSQLLNRMRGEEEPTTGQVVTEKQDEAVEKIAAEKSVVDSKSVVPNTPSTETLKPEEFIPKQKPVRMQSLDSLREIANTSAREAFRDSIAKERTVSTQTKFKIALISLAFAVSFFAMSYLMQERVNFWGVVCGIGFLIFGLLTARAYLSEKKLDESIISD